MTKRIAANFQKSDDGLACQLAQNLKFERPDWTSFRTVEGLQQKAGVSADRLRRLVLKELTDNALDTSILVNVGQLSNGGYFVEDSGSGIDGTAEEIARLFSIARPMISTKLFRLPTRGALGNGLRVVAGSVLASGGSLVVITRNQRIELRPERDGSTTVVSVKAVKRPVGTRIEISFGAAIPEDEDGHALSWARRAINMSLAAGETYAGKSSPWWYDVPQFHELLSASGDTPVRELVSMLDGCTGGRAGEIVHEAALTRTACQNVSREQAARLLQVARVYAKPVTPKRLGFVGTMFRDGSYATSTGTVWFGTAQPNAEIPFVIEAWAELCEGEDMWLGVYVNRTPVAGDIYATRDKRDIDFFGCGLSNTITKTQKDKNFNIWLNITTPYMPITSDGKEPNLMPFFDGIVKAVAKAVRQARRPNATGKQKQKHIVLDNLKKVIADVSGGGEYQFNVRQLLYGLRPIVMDEIGEELLVGNFTKIITEYEAEHGPIPGMYREPRGSITHPHRNETITLGDLMVKDYERPVWTFNKLVYIEKEGANEALKAVGWPERHDAAVMSSKGFSTRAARDLIDKLAEHDEPVQVFCVHDADGSGTMIYQTLQEETKARKARKITIINLGLEPWEAIAMGLEIETVKRGEKRKPVANYVKAADKSGEHGTAPDGESWEEWLQTHRIELNAMTTPQLFAWLDDKMAEHGKGKLIPPAKVLEADLAKRIETKVRAALTEQILREADLDGKVKTAIKKIVKPGGATLAKGIRQSFREDPKRAWRDHVEAVAKAKTKAKA